MLLVFKMNTKVLLASFENSLTVFIIPCTLLWINQNLICLLDQVELSCTFLCLIRILIYNQNIVYWSISEVKVNWIVPCSSEMPIISNSLLCNKQDWQICKIHSSWLSTPSHGKLVVEWQANRLGLRVGLVFGTFG